MGRPSVAPTQNPARPYKNRIWQKKQILKPPHPGLRHFGRSTCSTVSCRLHSGVAAPAADNAVVMVRVPRGAGGGRTGTGEGGPTAGRGTTTTTTSPCQSTVWPREPRGAGGGTGNGTGGRRADGTPAAWRRSAKSSIQAAAVHGPPPSAVKPPTDEGERGGEGRRLRNEGCGWWAGFGGAGWGGGRKRPHSPPAPRGGVPAIPSPPPHT